MADTQAWIDELSVRDVRDAVHQGLMRVLGDYGFVHDVTGEHQLLLRFPGGFHRITVPIFDEQPQYQFRFLLATRLDQVASITAAFAGVAPEDAQDHLCSLVDYGYFYGQQGKEYAIDSRPGLALAVTEMNMAIVDKLLPLLDVISDVDGLEALYNRPAGDIAFQLSKDEGYTALTLARLAGNRAFGTLCRLVLASQPAGEHETRGKLTQLIAHLENLDTSASAPPQLQALDARPADLSLRELRAMFCARAESCAAARSFDSAELSKLALALLTRGGVGELSLFAASLPEPALSARLMQAMPLAADMAASMRHACDERTSNPMFSERAPQYRALEGFFAAIAARGH